MAKNNSWGGMIEICAVAEIFRVNIEILSRNADTMRRCKWIGSFKYSINDARTSSLYILYSVNNHYDSMIEIVDDENSININGQTAGVDSNSQLSTVNDSSSFGIVRRSQTRVVERVKTFSTISEQDLIELQFSNDVLNITNNPKTTGVHSCKKRACRSTQDFITGLPQLKKSRSPDNEKSRVVHVQKRMDKTPEFKNRRLLACKVTQDFISGLPPLKRPR